MSLSGATFGLVTASAQVSPPAASSGGWGASLSRAPESVLSPERPAKSGAPAATAGRPPPQSQPPRNANERDPNQRQPARRQSAPREPPKLQPSKLQPSEHDPARLKPAVLPPAVAAAQATATGLAGDGVAATGGRLHVSGAETRFHLKFTSALKAEVYAMARPHRIVIDLPEAVAFRLPPRTGQQAVGVVAAWRFGLVAERQSRIVLDLRQPARVVGARMVTESAGGGSFELTLAPIPEAAFLKTAYEPPTLRRETLMDDPAPPPPPRPAGKPVVVIDPGHGGIDPGALGQTEIAEKDIVLAVGLALRRALQKTGRYDVHMTREGDVFLPLDERVRRSQALQADLFVSIHADAIADEAADKVRGATVYTLSERASDAVARRLAEKENASDALAGLATVADDDRDMVRNILIDLMKTETERFSGEFGSLLAERLKRTIKLSRTPRRSAAFKVLKQAQSPSVLIELGYMSNTADEGLMSTPIWQSRVAAAIGAAVDAYFQKPRLARQ